MEDFFLSLIKNIITPDLGGATEVTVIEVLVKSGDTIEKDANIVTLESDKATLEVPTTDAGVVKEVKVKIGDTVSTGSTLLTLDITTKDQPTLVKESKSAEKTSAAQEKPTITVHAEELHSQPVLTGMLETNNDVHAGPGVRRLARELGVNLALVVGSGPKQRIMLD